MLKMVLALSSKVGVNLNCHTFEIAIETLLQHNLWKESILLIRAMDLFNYIPSVDVCVDLAELLDRNSEYKAVLALYSYMQQKGYNFVENNELHDVFKDVNPVFKSILKMINRFGNVFIIRFQTSCAWIITSSIFEISGTNFTGGR